MKKVRYYLASFGFSIGSFVGMITSGSRNFDAGIYLLLLVNLPLFAYLLWRLRR